MYESVILDSISNSEIYKLSIYADPESSETTLTESEDSTDTSEEVNENDDVTSSGSEGGSDTIQDSEVSERSSGSDMSVDHTGDSDDMLFDRRDDTESQEEEGSHAGSDSDTGADLGDSENGETDGEEIEYDVNDIKNDSDYNGILEYDSLDGADEYVEYDGSELSGDGETQTRGATREASSGDSSGFESDSIEFYNRSLESLGIIAGCLFFIVFTIICKYIYKFFRLFF